MITDCDGLSVVIGSKVRLLRIDEKILQLVPDNERNDVASMIGDVVEVYDIRGHFLCVEKSWDRGDGKTESQMLSVIGDDVKLERP